MAYLWAAYYLTVALGITVWIAWYERQQAAEQHSRHEYQKRVRLARWRAAEREQQATR